MKKQTELSTFKKRNSCRSDRADPWIRRVFFLNAGFTHQSRITIDDGNIQLFGQWHACCKHAVDKIEWQNVIFIGNAKNLKVDIFLPSHK